VNCPHCGGALAGPESVCACHFVPPLPFPPLTDPADVAPARSVTVGAVTWYACGACHGQLESMLDTCWCQVAPRRDGRRPPLSPAELSNHDPARLVRQLERRYLTP
jgi:hypothetical protein